MPKQTINIPIAHQSDVTVATIRTMKFGQSLGMNAADSTMCATTVSELATNIVRYADKGTIILKHEHDMLYISAKDRGHGIEDIDLAMQEGHSSGSGLGMGLSGVSRMMDSFHIESKPGKGTCVNVSKYCKSKPIAPLPKHQSTPTHWLDIGSYLEPHSHCIVNGDGILSMDIPPYHYMALWDVSGHGEDAHQLSQQVECFLQQHLNQQPHKLIQKLDDNFRGSRGLVAVVARLNIDSGGLDYAGVGNISLLHISPLKKKPHRLLLQNGVIGYQIRTPINQRLQMHCNDSIIMHSDGICSIREPLDIKPQQSANDLAKHIGHHYRALQDDDVSCLVLRYRSGVQTC